MQKHMLRAALPMRLRNGVHATFSRAELTSHFLFQPIASSDLRPQHAPALRSVVPEFEQGEGPREVFET